jgi:2-polyprenyl-3-methyl-5-hydroxy-6-metoxy-1,4-benzoquinol methylase
MVTSDEIRSAYTNEYFLTDCGGYLEYQRFHGRRLGDERLLAMASIASLRSYGRVLDLGCGRGELTYYFASIGHRVTAVDYSADAIQLTRQTLEGNKSLLPRVELRCEDATRSHLTGEYEIVVAADVIEHLSMQELDRLYAKVAQHLSPTGIFIVHTFPNLWHYRYHYSRMRMQAGSRGEVWPEQPRSAYEQQMHINEQNPRVLRAQLARFFPFVRMWFGTIEDMPGNAVKRYSAREVAAARDIFAVASLRPVDMDAIRVRLQSLPITPVWLRPVRVKAVAPTTAVACGELFELPAQVENRALLPLNGYPPNAFSLSYRWLTRTGEVVEANGLRTPLLPAVGPGSIRRFNVQIAAPRFAGEYRLRLTLVQEWVQWFDELPIGVYCDLPFTVSGPRA